MITVRRTQQPVVRPLPALNDRTLRFANLWRTVALLADQAAEVKAKYPNAISVNSFDRQFEEALAGLKKVHAEFWSTASLVESADEARDASESEAHWLERNNLKAVQ